MGKSSRTTAKPGWTAFKGFQTVGAWKIRTAQLDECANKLLAANIEIRSTQHQQRELCSHPLSAVILRLKMSCFEPISRLLAKEAFAIFAQACQITAA